MLELLNILNYVQTKLYISDAFIDENTKTVHVVKYNEDLANWQDVRYLKAKMLQQ